MKVSMRPTFSLRATIRLSLCLISIAASLLPSACTKSERQPVADSQTASAPRPPQTAAPPPAPATPDAATNSDAAPSDRQTASLSDVQAALTRVYHDAVLLQKSRSSPFVTGDFNGDDSPDVAIVVTPARGKLSKINSEYASWLVGDPQKVVLPVVHGDVKILPKKPEPVVVREGDVLLAVIHGYQKEGWRNPLAAQTYLLKNAVGDEMKVEPARAILREAAHRENMPPLRGDVIRETRDGSDGFIYWTGAKYAWSQPQKQ